MSVKIRLQRHGKKGKPYYWIVAADSRSKRDGKYLEKLGIYNPNTNPATIEVDVDSSVKWLQNGAQPTKTARNILSYKGIMLKYHLMGGVAKGAFDEDEAEKRFNDWMDEKSKSIDKKKSDLQKLEDNQKAKALENEKIANEARIKAQEEALAAPAEEAPAEEAPAEEAPAEEAPAEEAPAEEAPAEEAPAEEAPAEEAPAEEAPAEEAPAEEAPAEEAAAEEKADS